MESGRKVFPSITSRRRIVTLLEPLLIRQGHRLTGAVESRANGILDISAPCVFLKQSELFGHGAYAFPVALGLPERLDALLTMDDGIPYTA